MNTPTVPCRTCGAPTHMTGTKKCDKCWEVEYRLIDYLKRGGHKAASFVLQALNETSPPARQSRRAR
jgi:hypothetical protein